MERRRKMNTVLMRINRHTQTDTARQLHAALYARARPKRDVDVVSVASIPLPVGGPRRGGHAAGGCPFQVGLTDCLDSNSRTKRHLG